MPVTTIGRTIATSQGVAIRGEFRVRSIATGDGDKIVRLAGPDDEGPYSLASQLFGSGLAERLGLYQPRRWIVEIPARIVTKAGWDGRLRHRMAAGVDVDAAFAVELDNQVVVADARQRASGESVLASLVVLDWLRLGDHVDHNFVFKNGQMIPIDFASAPAPEVWESATATPPTGEDSGGLRGEVHRVTQIESRAVRDRFDRINDVALRRILSRIPREMTGGHEANVVKVLMDRKQEVRDAHWP
jgi:hypothetical protein